MNATWSKFKAELPASLAAERRGALAILRLSRPAKRNAIDSTMLHGIKLFFGNLADDVKAVVLCSEGENFSAGLDLGELTETDAAGGMAHSREWHDAFHGVQYAPVPVIAVLRGAVIGAGLELASAWPIRVAQAT